MGPHLLHVDTRELKRLERDLATTKKKAVPYATLTLTNTLAFEARTEWQQTMGQKMKLRNRYTVNSVRVEKAKGLNMAAQIAVLGSVAPYMDEQEDGATESKSGKHGIPLPAAAPGKRAQRGKVGKARQFKAIRIMPTVRGHRSRQVAAAMAMAERRGGTQYAFLQLKKGRKGIYQLHPGRKRLGLKKVWDLSKSSVRIPKNPTLEPAVAKTTARRDGIWREALIFQLRRHKVLGYG